MPLNRESHARRFFQAPARQCAATKGEKRCADSSRLRPARWGHPIRFSEQLIGIEFRLSRLKEFFRLVAHLEFRAGDVRHHYAGSRFAPLGGCLHAIKVFDKGSYAGTLLAKPETNATDEEQ